MGVRILSDQHDDMAAIYDSVTDVAFGPIFFSIQEGGIGAGDVAKAFLDWLGEDPRRMLPADVVTECENFLSEVERDGWDAVVGEEVAS